MAARTSGLLAGVPVAGVSARPAAAEHDCGPGGRQRTRLTRGSGGGARVIRGWARFKIFGSIGAGVFALGLVMQIALVKGTGLGPVPAYLIQAVVCIQASFALNRYLTWRDRDVPFWVACWRWNTQKIVINAVNMAAFVMIVHFGIGYVAANIALSAAFTPVNFLLGHVWSFAERSKDPAASAAAVADPIPWGQPAEIETLIGLARATADARPFPVVEPFAPAPVTAVSSAVKRNHDDLSGRHRRRRKSKASLGGIIAVAAALAAGVTIARLPAARWPVYATWLTPFAELAMLAAGHAAFRWRFRQAPSGTFTQAIIQVTTTGAEYARVNEIIDQIRSYNLKIDYQVWVVIEPGHRADYPFADRVIIVPEDFTAKSRKKARALEYSRRVREALGLDRADVKIVFNDDDVSLTQAYIERAFAAGYDICEGVVTPRTAYAVRPLGHFLTSHADDIRTHACLVYCSVFQGIFGRPVHVHGEGLVVTGEAERIVTWNWPAIASEDLVFGQRAARAGLKWGWFHEYAEVTSPWSLRDYLIQRRRWLWGDIHAIRHRKVMPLTAAAMVLTKYLAGVMALLCSAAGLYLRMTGRIPATAGVLNYAKLAVLGWIGLFFTCGWIGASSTEAARSRDSRLLSGVLAVLMMPVSLALTFAAIAIPLIQGDPRSFAVISKTRMPR